MAAVQELENVSSGEIQPALTPRVERPSEMHQSGEDVQAQELKGYLEKLEEEDQKGPIVDEATQQPVLHPVGAPVPVDQITFTVESANGAKKADPRLAIRWLVELWQRVTLQKSKKSEPVN